MIFCVRVDDVGWTHESSTPPPLKKPDQGLREAARLHAALGGLPWLAAVIPATLDAAGAAWLASRPDGLEVALHGWDHQRVDGIDSEFRGRPEAQCRWMLRDGLAALGPTLHFVPPFNALEPALLDALAKENFRFLWGNLWETPAPPFRSGGMTHIPAWRRLYGATRRRMSGSAPALIHEIPKVIDEKGFAVITLHLPWEAAEESGFSGVRELAGLIRHNTVSPSRYLEIAR